MALRERLSQRNPERIITVEGSSQPAILVAENEELTLAGQLAECFYLRFGACRVAAGYAGATTPLLALECVIAYRTGTGENATKRGRALAALDTELMAICVPPTAPMRDYTANPAKEVGSAVFWTAPELDEVAEQGAELSRIAKLTIFFSAEEQS